MVISFSTPVGISSRVAVAAAAFWVSPIVAVAQPVGAPLVPASVFESAGATAPEGRQALEAYLMAGKPAPQIVAARAALAIGGLAGSGLYSDPADLASAAGNIAAAAQSALCPARVMQAVIPADFVLPTGVSGFDFGPGDAAPAKGFERVAPGDGRLVGANMRGQRPNQAGGLFGNGVAGIRRFTTPMENGVHRILLLTAASGEEATGESPLGTSILVNGRTIELGDHPASGWLPAALLRDPQAPGKDDRAEELRAAPGGGALMVEVEIASGQLEVQLQQPAGSGRSSYLVGILASPIAQGDYIGRYFEASQQILDTEQCLELEEEIVAAVADLLEEIAPAAGPQTEQLENELFEDGESASPA
jgi:hypothetical protein